MLKTPGEAMTNTCPAIYRKSDPKCDACMCMAWRWFDDPAIEDRLKTWTAPGFEQGAGLSNQEFFGDGAHLVDRRGYCGLIGKPVIP